MNLCTHILCVFMICPAAPHRSLDKAVCMEYFTQRMSSSDAKRFHAACRFWSHSDSPAAVRSVSYVSDIQQRADLHPPPETPGSHISLSIGGGCVMLHISTRDPSFSCRLGLYVPWVARRFSAATKPMEVRISTSSRMTEARLIDSKRSEVRPLVVS